MVVIFILILSLINFVNSQNSTDLNDSKITYVLAETPTKSSNTPTKNETADSTAIKTNPASNDSVMTYSMEGPSSAAGNETAVPESTRNSTSENKTTTTVTKVNQTNVKTTQASKKPNVLSTTPTSTNSAKSSNKTSDEANNNASDNNNTTTTTPSNSNYKNVTDSSNGINGNNTTSAYGDENYDDSSNNTTPNSNNTQNTNATTKPPPNNGKVYKENECHYNYTKGGRRGPENHYHCHNRRWIWGLVSVITFFVLIAFCVLCCRLCLGICLCTAIGNRATQQPRVNPYNQRTIYANDTIFLPPVPVYTMHANLNPFPLQTKGYHIHGGRPGTF